MPAPLPPDMRAARRLPAVGAPAIPLADHTPTSLVRMPPYGPSARGLGPGLLLASILPPQHPAHPFPWLLRGLSLNAGSQAPTPCSLPPSACRPCTISFVQKNEPSRRWGAMTKPLCTHSGFLAAPPMARCLSPQVEGAPGLTSRL